MDVTPVQESRLMRSPNVIVTHGLIIPVISAKIHRGQFSRRVLAGLIRRQLLNTLPTREMGRW